MIRMVPFARALAAQHPDTRSERSNGVCRVNGEQINGAACEEVREDESAGSPGVRLGANGGARRGRARPPSPSPMLFVH